jgi:hypothetical protein
MADLTLRSVKGSPLTNAELDGNFEYFTGSHAITGSLTITGSLAVTGSISTSGSLIAPYLVTFECIDDTTAAAAGVPVGGLYRNGNIIQIRLA